MKFASCILALALAKLTTAVSLVPHMRSLGAGETCTQLEIAEAVVAEIGFVVENCDNYDVEDALSQFFAVLCGGQGGHKRSLLEHVNPEAIRKLGHGGGKKKGGGGGEGFCHESEVTDLFRAVNALIKDECGHEAFNEFKFHAGCGADNCEGTHCDGKGNGPCFCDPCEDCPCSGVLCDGEGDGPCWCDPCPDCPEYHPSDKKKGGGGW